MFEDRYSRPARSAWVDCITLALGVAALLLVSLKTADALPSYARQTGQQCAACHNGFPELTPYGRLFKLNGYTFTGGKIGWEPPIAGMFVTTLTHTAKNQPGGAAPGFGPNDNFASTESLFYGGKIVDHLGAFAQMTLDQVSSSFHWDNTDIRYANVAQVWGRDLVYGASLNNNPTVDDLWNTTPAWSFPYVSSELAPTPAAHTLIEGGLAQQVVGFNPYIFWNRLIYISAGGYRTLGPWTQSALGVNPSGLSAIDGIAPSWRLAVEPAWGNNTWEFGTFGVAASLVPGRTTGAGTDRLTDFGLDTQYQFLGERDSFSVQARLISEDQNLSASRALGLATNAHDSMRTWQVKGSYFYRQTVGLTLGYFNIHGSSDPLRYGAVSAANSPNSDGELAEVDYLPFNYGGPAWWPWLNMKLGLQYVHYNSFNGASSNFDGAGTKASANDTVLGFAWLVF